MTLSELPGLLNVGNTFFLALAASGLAVAVIVEQSQILAKHAGARKKMVAGGYNAAMKIMVLNRLGTVFYFLFIAASIDLGAGTETIARYFVYAISAIAFVDVLIIALFIKWTHGDNFPQCVADGWARISLRPVGWAFVATSFGLMGLTIPMLLSAANPELRLTLANTGFVFNSIFTVVNVFFVESYMAKLIDSDDDRLGTFVVSVFIARFLSALLCITMFFSCGHVIQRLTIASAALALDCTRF